MSLGFQILSYVLVMVVGYMGGKLFIWMNNKQGEYQEKCKKEGRKAMIILKMSDLTGIILFCLMMRNLPFLWEIEQFYPTYFHSFLSGSATSIVLLRLGQQLKLDYELKRVLSLALFPYALEVFILSILIFNLIPNISILGAVTLSSVLPTIGPAIVTQIQIGFLNQRRGLDKNMPILLLSSTVFECIQSIIIFGVLSEIYLFSSNPKQSTSIITSVFIQLAYIALGFPLGALLTFFYKYVYKFIKNCYFQSIVLMSICILQYLVCKVIYAQNVAFTGILSFSYWTNKFIFQEKVENENQKVKEDNDKEISNHIRIVLDFLKVFLFGGVGAALVIQKLNQQFIQYSFIIIFVGAATRILATVILMNFFGGNYSFKDKIFMCVSWYAKGTIQASIQSNIFTYATNNNLQQLQVIGNFFVTLIALLLIFSIPLGSVLSLNTGDAWLSLEDDQVKQSRKVSIQLTKQELKDEKEKQNDQVFDINAGEIMDEIIEEQQQQQYIKIQNFENEIKILENTINKSLDNNRGLITDQNIQDQQLQQFIIINNTENNLNDRQNMMFNNPIENQQIYLQNLPQKIITNNDDEEIDQKKNQIVPINYDQNNQSQYKNNLDFQIHKIKIQHNIGDKDDVQEESESNKSLELKIINNNFFKDNQYNNDQNN